jgi:hypothetical protein
VAFIAKMAMHSGPWYLYLPFQSVHSPVSDHQHRA